MWIKNVTSVLLTAVMMTSACVGFSFSIKQKKMAPFVRIKTTHLDRDVKTEAVISYDFANQIVVATLELEEAKLIRG